MMLKFQRVVPRKHHQEFRSVPNMEGFLNLIKPAIFGAGKTPLALGRIHTAYIGVSDSSILGT